MSEKRWCPECRWRSAHIRGVCQTCEHDNGPSERELEESGQANLLDLPDTRPAA